MNPIAKEIASYLGSAELTDEEFLEHYGVPRRSGRYPWGSGEDPYQHESRDFLGRIEELKASGWEETTENIKKEFGLNSTQYRMEKRIALNDRRQLQVDTAKRLRDKEGLGPTEIGKRMGVRESTVRGWFKQDTDNKIRQCQETADFLKKQVDEKGMIDIGANVEYELNIPRDRLDTALYMLEREGYHVYGGRMSQPTNKNQKTTLKVLAKPDIQHKEIFQLDKIKNINEYISRDDGETFEKKFHYPSSMDSKRLQIRYAEDGGIDKDGIVELRRGVPDLSLGNSRYAQVRILVDGDHYIKGVAVYSDDMPDGVDVIFNTNKKRGTPKMDVLKEIKNDPDNPFGSAIKDADQGGQYWYTDPKTGKKKLGLINKRSDESDWSKWKDTLPSQFLSKQSRNLAEKQLNLAKADKEAEFEEIMSLNNPTVKKYYLDKFASSCDAAAVDLKAAALPGQKYHVIIPVNSLKNNEVYAPRYKDGTKLALIRYPHGGTFEIPILTVNNKNQDARKLIGNSSIDAIGIKKNVADRLSGADFDGDTVMCIPTNDRKGKVKIISTPELEELKGFDNKLEYGPTKTVTDKDGTKHYYRGDREYKIMKNTNTQMGIISNLITDMTLQGASREELAKAVKHSMVVIDAEKHKLDYKQSYIDNDIATLQKKYQPKYNEDGTLKSYGGASTIVSKSKGEVSIPKTRGEARINQKGKSWYDPSKPEGALIKMRALDKDLYYPLSTYNKKTKIKTLTTTDGKKISYKMDNERDREKYDPILNHDPRTGTVYFSNKDGSIKYKYTMRTTKSTRMAEADDAYDLVSPFKHPMEILYADYANSMKSLANKARKEIIRTGNLEYEPKANKIYAKEVSSLESKLNNALKNAPRERTALRLANVEINKKIQNNPSMKPDEVRKISQQMVSKYRTEVNSLTRKQRNINITDKEWEAIQAGAITENKLKKILDNSDPDVLRERAMPTNKKGLTVAQMNRIKSLDASNFTIAQIAEKMGLSPSTISKYLKGEK